MRIPVKLGHDTIGESVFELRFVPRSGPAFEMLLGSIYPKLQADFPNVIQLPIMQLPRNLIESDPNLHYQALNRLDGEHYGISVGRRAIAVHAKHPYQGWQNYRHQILDVVELLHASNVVDRVERFSLKYLNILPHDLTPEGIDALQVDLRMGSLQYKKTTIHIRTEIEKGPTLTIVQIATSAAMTTADGRTQIVGTMVDVDTIFMEVEDDFWGTIEKNLELIHSTEKEIFFSILTDSTLAKLEPEYT